ncbi:HEAT repeat domain-containing protein [Sorangium sp. So ce406]|uniref:HEAT repeat domain-containing protein n=1 Tax=Sorangium sp. So ce406 TaxID=3133311 RepID=UPI003F5CAD47
MRRPSPVLVLLVVALVLSLIPTRLYAEQRTSYLAEQLKANDDYRVRTQAALALGASGDDAATKPLCDALSDANASVKVAAAAALGRLGKPAGLPCLQRAEGREQTPAVKSQIQKSIATLSSGGASSAGGAVAPPPPGADTKYYVAIEITNKSGRPESEIEPLLRAAMQSKILAKPGYAVAPKGETVAQGKKILNGKKLKGFYLLATVEPAVYQGGNLTQVVRVSMWTYPSKSLQGEFAPKLTQSGTPKKDVQSENVLMKMCVENAVETFQKVVASL